MDDALESFVPLTFHRRGVQRLAVDRHAHDVTLIEGWRASVLLAGTCSTAAR